MPSSASKSPMPDGDEGVAPEGISRLTNMIACIIEFAIREGRESEHENALKSLLGRVEAISGFISEEIFKNTRNGTLLMISYWESRDAIVRWMADGEHRRAMAAGKEILSWYKIRVAEVEREYSWQTGHPSDSPASS